MDDLPKDDLFAATPEVAARLAGSTVRQLDYWREIGLIEPAVARRDAGHECWTAAEVKA